MKTINSNMHSRRGVVTSLIVCLVITLPAFGEYDLSWSTIDGGGGMSKSASGKYELTGTIGQPDAAHSEGGKFELSGGFWPGSVPPYLRVLDPNGGEILHPEDTYSITWESFGDAPIYDVNIECSFNNGSTWDPNYTIITTNDGQQDWEIPYVSSTKTECLIRISDVNDANVYDTSDGTFTIVKCWWEYPDCWDCDTQCHGDTDCDEDVDTVDWVSFRDGFGHSYPEPVYVLNACADCNRDGSIDTGDWPCFRDNFGQEFPSDCPLCDINEIFKP